FLVMSGLRRAGVACRARRSPTQRAGGPGEPGAERAEDHELAARAVEEAGARRLVERDRDRGGGRVPEAVDVAVALLQRDAEPLACALDDPQVDLVRDDAAELQVRMERTLLVD